jgi:hypothetical protein
MIPRNRDGKHDIRHSRMDYPDLDLGVFHSYSVVQSGCVGGRLDVACAGQIMTTQWDLASERLGKAQGTRRLKADSIPLGLKHGVYRHAK